MPTFKNFDEYLKYVNKQLKIVLEQIAEEVRQELHDTVFKKLYESYYPKEYVRTYDLLNSISKTEVEQDSDGSYYVKIYYDTDKIIPNYNENIFFNQHTDINGNSVVDVLPLWLEVGTANNNGNFFPRKGIHAIDDVKKWIDREFNKMFKKKLKQRGFKVK